MKGVLGYTLPTIPNGKVRVTSQFLEGLVQNQGRPTAPMDLMTSRFINVHSSPLPAPQPAPRSLSLQRQPSLGMVRVIVPPHLGFRGIAYEQSVRKAEASELARSRLREMQVRKVKQLRRVPVRLPKLTPISRIATTQRQQETRASAVFLSVPRPSPQNKTEDKLGPGFYQISPPSSPRRREKPAQSPPRKAKSLLLEQLVSEIKVEREEAEQKMKAQQKEKEKKHAQKGKEAEVWGCFKQSNHDRFGEQIFPVVSKWQTPSPGSYSARSMEGDAARARRRVEEREALLRWLGAG